MAKRGHYAQNKKLYDRYHSEVVELRNQGFGYGAIAERTGCPLHLVRAWTNHLSVNLGNAVRLGQPKIPFEMLRTKGHKRRRLIQERGHRCQGCGLSEWRGQPIMLELHNPLCNR